MARASKPNAVAHQAGAKAAPARRTVRRARRAPETATPKAATPEAVTPAAAAFEKLAEPAGVASPSIEGPAPLEAVADRPAVIAAATPVLREVERLDGITLSFWQGQLQRTVATGQAMLVCRSPQAAIDLQTAYLQATLASGFEHVGAFARLSHEIVRDLLPSRPR